MRLAAITGAAAAVARNAAGSFDGVRLPRATWGIAAIAIAEVILLIAFAGGYGYHRDELYFIQAGKHPAWGYDDQPPFTPLIGRLATSLFGQTPTGLRVPSALALGICVLLAGLTARQMGGGARAQLLAAGAFAVSSAMFIGHLLSTTTFDLLAWTITLYLVVKLLQSGDVRLWPWIGLVVGVALLNKWLILFLVVSLALGLVAARRFELLRSRWLLAGIVIALALWAPNLIWQAQHGWPQQTLSGQISGDDPVGTRIGFLPFQLLMVSPVLAPIWIVGLIWLWRGRHAMRFRPVAYGYVTFLVIGLLGGAKGYYAAGWYPALLAAGGVRLEGWLAQRRAQALVGVGLAAALAVSMVLALPIVPQRSLADTPIGTVNKDVLETVRWPHFVDAVAGVYRSLPAADQRHAVIFTMNYGEAGALRRYGPKRDLPGAYSGHNSFWSFGRPRDGAAPVIVVGMDGPYLNARFRGCRIVTHYNNGLRIDQQEQGAPIGICAGPVETWSREWPRLHHLDA
jgi:hypothetical protein